MDRDRLTVTATERLRVRLLLLRSGWSGLQLIAPQIQYEHAFSHTPEDTLTTLAEAVDAVLAGGTDRTVVLRDGSHEADLRFVREGLAPVAQVTISEHDGYQRTESDPGAVVLSLSMPVAALGKAFWRGFRELQSVVHTSEFPRHWRYPFPASAVERLGRRLRDEP